MSNSFWPRGQIRRNMAGPERARSYGLMNIQNSSHVFIWHARQWQETGEPILEMPQVQARRISLGFSLSINPLGATSKSSAGRMLHSSGIEYVRSITNERICELIPHIFLSSLLVQLCLCAKGFTFVNCTCGKYLLSFSCSPFVVSSISYIQFCLRFLLLMDFVYLD